MMLGPYSDYSGVFIETTKSEHLHGGAGWEFGTCLWSPSRNRVGHDTYALIREPGPGDLLLHLYKHSWPDGVTETRLCGRSLVSKACREVTDEPPSPGVWAGMSPYYRIDLQEYEPFAAPLPVSVLLQEYGEEIRQDALENRPKYYPFAKYRGTVQLTQGMYLSRCTPILYQIYLRALGIEQATASSPEGSTEPHFEYEESRRRSSERYFFARNPQLTEAVKQHYGYRCQACHFDFAAKYGDLGNGYIEAHHLNPLSERPELEWTDELKTRVADVTVLCANCHRMIHRRRPALSLKELRFVIKTASSEHAVAST
jgi:5-methylcytosine-specific restriction endonuclease McrA